MRLRWLLSVSLVFALKIFAQRLPAHLSRCDGEYILRARDLTYQQNYTAAAEWVQKICQQPGGEIAGLFWQSCLIQLLIYDSGNTALVDSFYRTGERVMQICARRLKANPADARAHLYLGLTLLNRANLLSWQNKKLNAFLTMLKVPSHLEKALALDPELYDALFGLAVVEYFKATADRYCLGLGLLGSRQRAYEMMESARKNARLLQPMAEFMLGFMYKEDQHYEAAIKTCQQLLSRYPDNRAARRLLRDIYLKMGNFQQVICLCRELDADIRANFPNNRYCRAENYLKMAYAWEGIGRVDSADAYADRIISWEKYCGSVPWLGNYVREAKWLKSRPRRI